MKFMTCKIMVNIAENQNSHLEVGTYQELYQHDFLPYIVECTKTLDASSVFANASTVILNLSAALCWNFS